MQSWTVQLPVGGTRLRRRATRGYGSAILDLKAVYKTTVSHICLSK
jgi:hypothetical protein